MLVVAISASCFLICTRACVASFFLHLLHTCCSTHLMLYSRAYLPITETVYPTTDQEQAADCSLHICLALTWRQAGLANSCLPAGLAKYSCRQLTACAWALSVLQQQAHPLFHLLTPELLKRPKAEFNKPTLMQLHQVSACLLLLLSSSAIVLQ